MQATYAPRDPIGEFWQGKITLRQLRVLVEGLPPDNAVVRARNNGLESWHDSQYLLHQIESRLRELQAAVANLGGAKIAAEDLTYLPTPDTKDDDGTPLVTEQQINEMDALQDRMFGGN